MRLIFAIVFLLSTFPAAAQQRNCGPMEQIRGQLASEFGEAELRQGVSQRGWLMHLFVSPSGETWTIVGELPGSGTGCVLDGGTDFHEPQEAEAQPEGEGS